MRQPAEVFSPGEYIQDELDARGWTTADLAERMGDRVAINQLAVEMLITVKDKGCMVGEPTAKALARAFGTSPEYWLNLDRAWRES